jgi:hypothetical protein
MTPEGASGAVHDRVTGALGSSFLALSGAFARNELAYLATTSKVELPTRDRLAWLLHVALGDDFVVSREWRRADLAVLAKDAVVAQIEAKALYTFDILKEVQDDWPPTGFIGRLQRDADKMAALAQSDRWLLSLITDIRGPIPRHLGRHVVKYASGISKATRNHGEELRATAHQAWATKLDEVFGGGRTTSLQIEGGSVWGLEVSVDLFLTGPLDS